MNAKILLHVENRFLKGILLKSIAGAGIEVLDIIDIDDMNLKLNAYGSNISLAIFEITDWNMNALQIEIERFKFLFPSIPIMAIVSKDTSDIVTFAMRAGIRDVLLLPKSREAYPQAVREKMEPYYERLYASLKENEPESSLELIKNVSLKESLDLELKHARRGGYPVSFIMAHLDGNKPDLIREIERIRALLRDTDKVMMVDDQTFIGVFPFTPKDHIPIIEQKFREAFKKEFEVVDDQKKLYIFGTTFTNDEADLESLLKRLEKGINNSMAINSIRAPLNNLSKSDIETFKQKLKQYKNYF